MKYLAKEGYRDENKDMVTAYYDNGEVKYVYDWAGVTSKEEFWIEHYDRDGKYVGKINRYENHLIDRDGNELLRKEESSYEDDEYWVDLYFANQLISHSCAGENLSYNVMGKDLIAYFEQEIKEQLDSIISDGWGRCDVEIDGKEYEINGIWPYAYPYAVFCYDEWDNSVHVEVYNEQFTYLHKNGIIVNPDGNTNANGFTFSVPIDRLTGSQAK